MATAEPGSYRDPTGRVVYRHGDVLRLLTEAGDAGWSALRDSGLAQRLAADGRMVATEELAGVPDDVPAGDWARALRHDRVPFVSYPYEWSFSMLRDAALLHLGVLRAALAENLVLKDATPYNVQFTGTAPLFIDVGSFEPLGAGEPWVAYRQFCEQFLYPLLLRALVGVPFQPWLRGRLDGIDVQDMRRLLRGRDLLRPSVLAHVVLHARADRRYAASGRAIRDEVRDAGFPRRLIEANVDRLTKVVAGLDAAPAGAEWTGYAGCDHVGQDRDRKAEVVGAVLARRRWDLVWDLGTNDGHFARLAAAHAGTVVAVDGDEAVLDRLYLDLRGDGPDNVLPLVVDLADPSPGLGWAGEERRPLADRGSPDLVLCLALLHHLAITRSIPVPALVRWLRSLDAVVVLEFADRDDAMVRRLLANRRDAEVHPGYAPEPLRGALEREFVIRDTVELPSGHRTLFVLDPR